MGKRIIQQRRGRGSPTYRVRKKASMCIKVGYPSNLNGEYEVIKLFSLPSHSAPIAKLKNNKGETFHYLAIKNLYVGQKINYGGDKPGDIAQLKDIKIGINVCNIEHTLYDGGKFIKTGGNSGLLQNKNNGKATILMPSKKEKVFDLNSRVTIGVLAGDGAKEKPILKAGKQFYIKKSKSKLWPRTSAVAMNAIDHPFGSGRGKRVKSKIAKRNAAPGKKVGLIRPRRTGRKKR